MLSDSINEMLEMAEWFKKNGYRDEYRNLTDTANKILDYIYFIAQERGAQGAEIARPEPRSGVQHGAVTSDMPLVKTGVGRATSYVAKSRCVCKHATSHA